MAIVWLVASKSASKSRRNSLTVNAIRPTRPGARHVRPQCHGQEGVAIGQSGPSIPGSPAPDLVLIEPDQTFGGLERFLDAPPLAGDGDQARSGTGRGE